MKHIQAAIEKIISEATIDDLVHRSKFRDRKRGERLQAKFIGTRGKNIVIYQCGSSGQLWTQTIQLGLLGKKDITMPAIRKALLYNVLVHCDCPMFKYGGYQYIVTSLKAAIEGQEELRYPKIRNPHLVGALCKHLCRVLTTMQYTTKDIYNSFKQRQEKG